jgi:hypothetical protein
MILSKRAEPKRATKTAVIFQGEIAVSPSGSTSIYSPGYAGCLAVIVAASNGPGGLVAHIAETGYKIEPIRANRLEYMKESIRLVLELAATRLKTHQFDVALFKGWESDLKNDWDLGSNPHVRLFDFRPQSLKQEAGSFTFDPAKRKVYIGDQSDDRLDALGTERGNLAEKASLTVTTGAKPMPVLVYA